MKVLLSLIMVLVTCSAFAETERSRLKRKEMSERVSLLRAAAKDGQTLFKEQKISEACVQVQKLVHGFPNHLEDILLSMDLFSKRVQTAKRSALEMHCGANQLSQLCSTTETQLDLDPEAAAETLKGWEKTLKSHARLINDEDHTMGRQNFWQYDCN